MREREREITPTYNEAEKKTINSSSHNITIIIIIGIEQRSKLSHRYSHISGTDEKEKNKIKKIETMNTPYKYKFVYIFGCHIYIIRALHLFYRFDNIGIGKG